MTSTVSQRGPTDPKSSEQPTDHVRPLPSVGRWYIAESLGKGAYSWVMKGYDKKVGKAVALKFLSKANPSWAEAQEEQIRTEIECLKTIKHPNVVQLYGYNLKTKYPNEPGSFTDVVLMVLEYAPGGELFDILYYTNCLEEDIARTYFRQMILALEACHNAGIVHRDLKPQNMLLSRHFNLKLIDFGLSKMCTEPDELMHTSYVGTKGYQAPELLLNRPFDARCDIFSVAVVLFILITGYPPFEQALETDRWYTWLMRNDTRKFWKKHQGCAIESDEHARDLMERMMAFDPEDRITIAEIKEHPWFNGPVLEGKPLISALKKRHSKMKARKAAEQEVVCVQAPVNRAVFGEREFDLPTWDPENQVEQLKDIHTTVPAAQIRDHIHFVMNKYGAVVEFDQDIFQFLVTIKLTLARGREASMIKFEIAVWRMPNSDQKILRFRRVKGACYDFHKVRQLIERDCAPIFIGGELGADSE